MGLSGVGKAVDAETHQLILQEYRDVIKSQEKAMGEIKRENARLKHEMRLAIVQKQRTELRGRERETPARDTHLQNQKGALMLQAQLLQSTEETIRGLRVELSNARL